MKIGAMNDPKKDLYKEIKFIAENFDFLDLTIEPETAYADDVDVDKILKLTKEHNLNIIGHTPWNLPIASSYKTIRNAAFEEYLKCLKVFRKLKLKLVNVHPVIPNDMANPDKIIKYNIEFFKKVVKEAKKYNIKIMLENTKAIFNEISIIAKILDEVPSLKLHWDVGHANLGNEGEKKTKLAFHNFKNKILHLHLSDNNGQEDQHLPLGTGNINWPFIVKTLKEYNYNKTITLEVHTPDLSYLLFSRDKLKFLLENIGKDKK
jgi:sugar phosphate isomerase/epimerase